MRISREDRRYPKGILETHCIESIGFSKARKSTGKNTTSITFAPTDDGSFGETGGTASIDQDCHVTPNRASSCAVRRTDRRGLQHLGLHFGSEEYNLHRTFAITEIRGSK